MILLACLLAPPLVLDFAMSRLTGFTARVLLGAFDIPFALEADFFDMIPECDIDILVN